MIIKKKIITLIFLCINVFLLAHPHLFAGVDIDFDIVQCDSLIITQRWMFDDLTSMIILEDFDSNSDDKIDSEELQDVKSNVIPGLKEKSFYTDLNVNNENIIVNEIYNFSVGVDDIYVYYKFDIKVPLKVGESEDIIKLNIYDREFYTKFFVNSDSGLKVIKPEGVSYSFDVYENPEKSYYLGQLNPLEVKLTIEKVN